MQFDRDAGVRQLVPQAELRALTGLRGVLAIWVVLLHTAVGLELKRFTFDERIGAPVANLIFSGILAVDCFFILSGFVLSYVYTQRFQREGLAFAPQFLLLRLARIYPVHITIIAIYLVIVLSGVDWPAYFCGNPTNRDAFACERFSSTRLLESVALVNAWGIHPDIGWNLPAWSISSEWFAYLMFPFVVLVASKFGPAPAAITALLALAGMNVMLPSFVPMFFGLGDDYGLLRLVPEFLCGVMLYRVHQAGWFESVNWPAVAAATVIGLVVCLGSGVMPEAAVFGFALLILALTSSQRGRVSSWLSGPTMNWLGRISYSVYMVNMLVLEALAMVQRLFIRGNPVKHVWQVCATLAAAVLLGILLGALLHRFVEEPARLWARRRFGDDARAKVPASA